MPWESRLWIICDHLRLEWRLEKHARRTCGKYNMVFPIHLSLSSSHLLLHVPLWSTMRGFIAAHAFGKPAGVPVWWQPPGWDKKNEWWGQWRSVEQVVYGYSLLPYSLQSGFLQIITLPKMVLDVGPLHCYIHGEKMVSNYMVLCCLINSFFSKQLGQTEATACALGSSCSPEERPEGWRCCLALTSCIFEVQSCTIKNDTCDL